MKVAFLGAGNMLVAPSVIAALSTTCGERPLEVHLFDGDLERLDLIDRFARVCFHRTDYGHEVRATDRPHEATESAKLVLMGLDETGVAAWQHPVERLPDRGEDYRPSDWSTDAWVIPGQGDRSVDEDKLVEDLLPLRMDGVSWIWLEGSLIPQAAFMLEDIAVPWPKEYCAETPEVIPHQILRWIRGDEQIGDWLKRFDDHPLKVELNRLEMQRGSK